jgi:hypothetical protein
MGRCLPRGQIKNHILFVDIAAGDFYTPPRCTALYTCEYESGDSFRIAARGGIRGHTLRVLFEESYAVVGVGIGHKKICTWLQCARDSPATRPTISTPSAACGFSNYNTFYSNGKTFEPPRSPNLGFCNMYQVTKCSL